ncbi:MAG: 50S ribosomal protein L15 [Planctomycetota bacterium]|nr:50S ribosomal protein L15 [Planctomycetota bacterium]
MNICDVNRRIKAHRRAKRRGRGPASGLGKTCGRGQKGKGARRGTHWLRGFIGGQSPLRARLPKRGFSNAIFRVEYVPVNLAFLQERFEAGAVVGPEEMRRCGVVWRQGERIKILGAGDISKALTVRAHAFSASAKAKIEKAGGAVEVIACQ